MQVPATEKGSPRVAIGGARGKFNKIMGPFSHIGEDVALFSSKMILGAFPKPISYEYMYMPVIASGS